MNLLACLSVIFCVFAVVYSDSRDNSRGNNDRPYLRRNNNLFDRGGPRPKPNPLRRGIVGAAAGRPGPFRPRPGPRGLPGDGRSGPLPRRFLTTGIRSPLRRFRPGPPRMLGGGQRLPGMRPPLQTLRTRSPLRPPVRPNLPSMLLKRSHLPRRGAPGPRKALGRFTVRRMGTFRRRRVARLAVLKKVLNNLRESFGDRIMDRTDSDKEDDEEEEEEDEDTLLEEFIMKLADALDDERFGDRIMDRTDSDKEVEEEEDEDTLLKELIMKLADALDDEEDDDGDDDDDVEGHKYNGVRRPLRRRFGTGSYDEDEDGPNFFGRGMRKRRRQRFSNTRMSLMKQILKRALMRLDDDDEDADLDDGNDDGKDSVDSLLTRLLDVITEEHDDDEEELDDDGGAEAEDDGDMDDEDDEEDDDDERSNWPRYGRRRRPGGYF